MKLNQLILPIVATGVGAAFFFSGIEEAQGWNTNGSSLGLVQRDFRIYNNFSGSGANNNNTPDDQFPAYQGADMAIWKACVEWGSIAHGDGTGDPTQAVLGSSGANFDPSFQGNATAVGGTNSNTHSQISGSSGGVLAYAEGPYSDGWRIRYYENWNWADGPGNVGGGAIDLQSIATHEYGHALGLNHSNAGGATMTPSYGGGTGDRSISADDQAGCQAIYGVIAASKPSITGLSIIANQITITGTNFDATGNEVWFTQAGAGGSGTPVKAFNVTSNGTSITVPIPAGAGPGDVLVRSDGNAFSNLSNSWPTDLVGAGGCTDPVNYCASLPNSVGSGATIGSSGSTSLSINDLTLDAFGLPSNVPGIFFYGNNEAANLFGEGLLCIQGGIVRLNVQVTGVLGTVDRAIDVNSAPFNSGSGQAISGETKRFQFWYRDVSGGPSGFNTTDGLAVTWCD